MLMGRTHQMLRMLNHLQQRRCNSGSSLKVVQDAGKNFG